MGMSLAAKFSSRALSLPRAEFKAQRSPDQWMSLVRLRGQTDHRFPLALGDKSGSSVSAFRALSSGEALTSGRILRLVVARVFFPTCYSNTSFTGLKDPRLPDVDRRRLTT